MLKFPTITQIIPINARNTIIDQLKQDALSVQQYSSLQYKTVSMHIDCHSTKGQGFQRIDDVILIVEENEFKLQTLPENNTESPSWDFCGCDLTNFVFHGDAYSTCFFQNTNLTGADLSSMQTRKLYFNNETILTGVKFPFNIFSLELLSNIESNQAVIAQLGRTYSSNEGAFTHRRWSFWEERTAVNVVNEYRIRAKKNPGGASEKTLLAHGLTP